MWRFGSATAEILRNLGAECFHLGLMSPAPERAGSSQSRPSAHAGCEEPWGIDRELVRARVMRVGVQWLADLGPTIAGASARSFRVPLRAVIQAETNVGLGRGIAGVVP